jgi:hypothetical protein
MRRRGRTPAGAIGHGCVGGESRREKPDSDNSDDGRRLDRLTRQVERLERHVTISNEALALFVRFWLTVTPPLPDTAQPAAQAKGRERNEGFVEALGRRLAKGQSLAQEVSQDVVGKDGALDRADSSS